MMSSAQCSDEFFNTVIEDAEGIARATFKAAMHARIGPINCTGRLDVSKLRYLGKRVADDDDD